MCLRVRTAAMTRFVHATGVIRCLIKFNRFFQSIKLESFRYQTNSKESKLSTRTFWTDFQTIAEKARNDIFEIDVKPADEQRKEYRKKYDANVPTMWSVYRGSTNRNESLSQVMVQLIMERCRKIGERVQCIYKFKANMKNI